MRIILEYIRTHVEEQHKIRRSQNSGLKCEFIPATGVLFYHALIISGIKPCGKRQAYQANDKEFISLKFALF